MKKALLGTTALVASGLLAGAASAADIVPAPIPEPVEMVEEGFTLSINGDAVSMFSFRDTDECDDENNVVVTGDDIVAAAGVGDHIGIGSVSGTVVSLDVLPDSILVTEETVTTTQLFDASLCAGHDDELTSIFWDSGLDFTAEITLSNGLHVAAYMEMDAFGDTEIGDYWLAFTGNFGQIQMGQMDGALKQALVTGPGVATLIGTVDGQDGAPLIESNTSEGAVDGPEDGGLSVVYFTPRLAGFQFGVEYSPDSDGDGVVESDDQAHVVDSDDQYIHLVNVGANYETEIGAWGLAIGGGWGVGEAETSIDTEEECLSAGLDRVGEYNGTSPAGAAFGAITGDYGCGDLEHWAAGAAISNEFIEIGGFYSEADYDFGFTRSFWGVEALATSGAWSYGIGYGNEEDEHYVGSFTDETDIIAGGISKNLGPGVDVSLVVNWEQQDPAYRKALGLGEIEAIMGGIAAGVAF